MTRDEILEAYNVDASGRITSPGAFEGAPLFAPALWEAAMFGFADRDDGRSFFFSIPKSDPMRKEFPEMNRWLGRKRSVRLFQNDQGFIFCR